MQVFARDEDLSFYDHLFEPVIALDEQGRLIYFNHSFRIFSQLSPRELKNVCLHEILFSSTLDVLKFWQDGFKLFKSILTEEVDICFSDEVRRVAVLKTECVKTEGRQMLIICFNDMSVERGLYEKYRQNIEELQSAYKQILQADKLTTMGELTASISHEITNPLTIAKGNLEMMEYCLKNKTLDSASKKEKLQKGFRNVWDAIIRINDIIQNMRSFLHSSGDKKEYCRLEDIVKNAVGLVANFYQSGGVKLLIEINRADLVILANRVKIEQVLINLLKNAFDAIKGAKIPNGMVKIHVIVDREQDVINIDVIDNGPGIESANRDQIFNMFFTTKNLGEGTGLGLSICKRIIESHSGTLTLVSAETHNTVFRVQIPVIEASSYSYNETCLRRVRQSDGKKILVIDNEVEVLNVINSFFKDSGYVFIGSTNGEEALSFLDNVPVDLIITDVEMPIMDGVEFTKKVREKGYGVPVYYLSSLRNVDKYNEYKETMNLSGFIIKPFSQQQIMDAVRHSLGE